METVKLAVRLPKHAPAIHPGEFLLEDFLIPFGMTQAELAKRIGVSYPRINEIVKGKRGVTADTALRLARLFGTTAEFWLNGQLAYDVWHALHSDRAEEIQKIEPLRAA
jgi:addiction module HigA family antidote